MQLSVKEAKALAQKLDELNKEDRVFVDGRAKAQEEMRRRAGIARAKLTPITQMILWTLQQNAQLRNIDDENMTPAEFDGYRETLEEFLDAIK